MKQGLSDYAIVIAEPVTARAQEAHITIIQIYVN